MLPLLALTLLAADPSGELRRETTLDFAVDEALQADGGVQYFYELAAPTKRPAPGSALARFRAMDQLATIDDPYHLVISKLVYTIERDISFFTEARARDLSWLQRVAPEMGVTAEPDGIFRVARTPSNRFKLTWLDAPAPGDDAGLTAFFTTLPADQRPASIVVQHNFDFARVMGWRTAERAITYTAHYSLGPGRTRIYVCSISSLHHLPPFFLGGKDRVFRESLDGAARLIDQLRSTKAGED